MKVTIYKTDGTINTNEVSTVEEASALLSESTHVNHFFGETYMIINRLSNPSQEDFDNGVEVLDEPSNPFINGLRGNFIVTGEVPLLNPLETS